MGKHYSHFKLVPPQKKEKEFRELYDNIDPLMEFKPPLLM
jgi:hypothetical protein